MKLFLLFIFLTACDSPLRHMKSEKPAVKENIIEFNDSLQASVTWTQGPYGNPDVHSALEIRFLDEDLKPTKLPQGDQLFVQASMGMDHGMASAGDFYTEDSHLWKNDTLAFYMGGNYTISLYIFDKNYNEIGRSKWFVLF